MTGDGQYTYAGSGGVLRNRLNIREADRLDRAVNAYATFALADIYQDTDTNFTVSYLRSIHKRMFDHLFDWAGQNRTVHVHAAGTNLHYLDHARIADRLEELDEALAAEGYLVGLDAWAFADRLAKHWRDLTLIHPFRDGNTRSQATFVSRLAASAGHPLDWSQINPAHLQTNRLAAINGFPQTLADYLHDRMLTTLTLTTPAVTGFGIEPTYVGPGTRALLNGERPGPAFHPYNNAGRRPRASGRRSGSVCGKPTKAGGSCQRRGVCPYHR